MKILVLGASGQLGQCLKKVAAERNISNISFPDESKANILDTALLQTLFTEEMPTHVINCAAYTAVDKAEDDVELCRKINKDGALNIAGLCKENKATLIHVSTDFVFKGDKPELLKEDDLAEPINIYGLTKLEGEQDVINNLKEHFILRTSWLYSEYANNFVKTMLRLGADRDVLNVIADQIGTPTYAIDLAGAILSIIESGQKDYGVYHYSNEGVTSWYDFAVGIFELGGTKIKVKPISTSQYPTKAIRPKFSVMDKTKIKSTFGLEIPYWRDSLQVCIARLKY
ncbi:dTDP-4-dehydrorhamnose reductase [Pedobacter heparinus]|uniref:dTDP-4-dehydrorhamnose reductase n=1 Tax=Pedobacter heparinus (strain ATCC 13125 / DSM 2366 / CIP 104194 / JCM 7457 / NBRC 12017 / NCIMB 9290 / NRRL B-14731 / HIM 762-3) TaxID=485917 RepID=C6XVN3_PEDHD|nr:dTDP-4-dehydrorhamnose reductase [Pedobacter heparinus]ACU06108.1 dTDP-4-dehydrorhamnose reductase [Pedobacter heparinus DSM 2366]